MTERTQLNVNISPELLKLLKQNAIKSGLTLAKYVTQLIQSYVSKEDLIEDEHMINKRINSMESQLIEISEKLNSFNRMIPNTSLKEEKESISDLVSSPRKAAKPKKPSSANIKRMGILIAQHFKDIQREEVLSAKEAWKLFLDQENSKLMKDEHLTAILDVFRGEESLTLEVIQGIGLKYGRCSVLADLRTMSDLPIKRELNQLVNDVEMYIAHMANKQNKTFEIQPIDV